MSDGSWLANLPTEELAGRVWQNRRDKPGHRYARKSNRPHKEKARGRILRLLTRKRYPKLLAVLTMPGLDWSFEWSLLASRETRPCLRDGRTRRTVIYAIEGDEAIYRAAMKKMPGLVQTGKINWKDGLDCATACYRTRAIRRYWRCTVEDYAEQDDTAPVHLAWLDFNGPLSAKRLRALRKIWRRHVRDYLVVTLMRARTNADVKEAVEAYGGLTRLLESAFAPAQIIDVYDYHDTAPMSQIIFGKP